MALLFHRWRERCEVVSVVGRLAPKRLPCRRRDWGELCTNHLEWSICGCIDGASFVDKKNIVNVVLVRTLMAGLICAALAILELCPWHGGGGGHVALAVGRVGRSGLGGARDVHHWQPRKGTGRPQGLQFKCTHFVLTATSPALRTQNILHKGEQGNPKREQHPLRKYCGPCLSILRGRCPP